MHTDYILNNKDNNNLWSVWHFTLELTQTQIFTGLFSVTDECSWPSPTQIKHRLAHSAHLSVQLLLKLSNSSIAQDEVTDRSYAYLLTLHCNEPPCRVFKQGPKSKHTGPLHLEHRQVFSELSTQISYKNYWFYPVSLQHMIGFYCGQDSRR